MGPAPSSSQICGVVNGVTNADCSGAGTCSNATGTCTCLPGFAGATCNISVTATCSSGRDAAGLLCCPGAVVDQLGACCPSGEESLLPIQQALSSRWFCRQLNSRHVPNEAHPTDHWLRAELQG